MVSPVLKSRLETIKSQIFRNVQILKKMGSWSATDGGFGFDDINFSNRVLCLHVLSSDPKSECDEADFRVTKLHINSLVLASKSPFFLKMFKNGMKESQNKDEVTLKINPSEESAFMDLLKFMYGLSLGATSAPDLVNVLIAADKFEVPSCVKQCIDLLVKLPMSIESALLYLGLPSSVSEGELVQPLIHTTKKYLEDRYKNFTESQEEVLGLPLCAIEIILGLDGLRVDSEDAVFDFILKWARLNYQEHEERQEILSKRLVRFLCFSRLSRSKIKEVMDCSDFDYGELSKLVVDALWSSNQVRDINTGPGDPRRVYKLIPINVVHLELAQPRCAVYFDLRKEECADLVRSQRLISQTFCLAGECFYLSAKRNQDKDTLGIYVSKSGGSETCTLDVHFSAMNKVSKQFKAMGNFVHVVKRNNGWGYPDAFETPWEKLMGDESEYFIDGMLHLRADITFIK